MTGHESASIFEQPYVFGGKTIEGRLVIPSGIRCTRASTIEWCFLNVPSVGIVTTKSISLRPRPGYFEPIYARYAQDCYINAVGLSNPGAEQFRSELRQIEIPGNKFLLVSIFGGNVKQFVETAEVLRDVADGFELNMSCPHAEGYGVEIGQNKELVAEITAAVLAATRLPVIVKLSAVVGDVGQTAKASIEAGAAGITITNTIGPATVNIDDTPVLSNKIGGLSGVAIRPLGLRSVKRVRDAIGTEPVIIGMGGIATSADLRDFAAAGADFFGVGSALTGMDSETMRQYFSRLVQPTETGAGARLNDAKAAPHTPVAELPQITMEYVPARVVQRQEYYPGLFKLVLDKLPIHGTPGELAGKYFFLCVPGVGEKPFAIFSAEEKSIVVKTVGRFTDYLSRMTVGSQVYLRGPYGQKFPSVVDQTVVLVGGGTGIASVLEIARLLHGDNRVHFILGGRSAGDLFDLDQFKSYGQVQLATNDGSLGHRGFVSDVLEQWLQNAGGKQDQLFVLCGPEPMVEACFKLLKPRVPSENIWASIEYMTSCGVGICGKCASPSGALTCIDGPFLQAPAFEKRSKGRECSDLAGITPQV